MKGLKSPLVALGGVAAVILISVFGATSAGTQAYKPELMAAWVQATGAIAAIVGAFWINLDQHRKEAARARDAERAEARKSVTILRSLTDSLRTATKEAADRLDDKNQGETTKERTAMLRATEQLHAAYSELMLPSMPDEDVAQLLLDCRWHADTAMSIARVRFRIRESVSGSLGKGNEWRFIENGASECLAKIDECLRKYR
ncbi:hypothetical protein [Burkholderia sp. AW49-1]